MVQVALIFLAQGPIHLEPIWRAFLEAASRVELKVDLEAPPAISLNELVGGELKPALDVLPREEYPAYIIQKKRKEAMHAGTHRSLQQRRRLQRRGPQGPGQVDIGKSEEDSQECWATNATVLASEVERLLSATTGGEDVAQRQKLFTLYVNAPEGHHYHEGSVFHGRKIPNPVDTEGAYAEFILVEAQLRLLEEALLDPLNAKFVMLSDSTIPVHRPEIVYLQLIHEDKSRINACQAKDTERWRLNPQRWDGKMKTDYLNISHWRKSSFWNALRRDHAELALADRHVSEQFRRYCYSMNRVLPGFTNDLKSRTCIADEHFIPTLLASYGLEQQ
ncbi:unnamed protein product, partial [Ostreobium quekettii]